MFSLESIGFFGLCLGDQGDLMWADIWPQIENNEREMAVWALISLEVGSDAPRTPAGCSVPFFCRLNFSY